MEEVEEAEYGSGAKGSPAAGDGDVSSLAVFELPMNGRYRLEASWCTCVLPLSHAPCTLLIASIGGLIASVLRALDTSQDSPSWLGRLLWS